MPVTLEKLPDEIRFVISGPIAHRIFDWKDAMDRLVFEKQVATKSVPRMHRAQKQAYEDGKILPYYGWGGGWGGYRYTLQMADGTCQVVAENMLAETSQEFSEMSDDSLVDALSTVDNDTRKSHLILFIERIQLKSLHRWKHWIEDQALTSRYVYEFTEAHLGLPFYWVQIEDRQTNNKTDLLERLQRLFRS